MEGRQNSREPEIHILTDDSSSSDKRSFPARFQIRDRRRKKSVVEYNRSIFDDLGRQLIVRVRVKTIC